MYAAVNLARNMRSMHCNIEASDRQEASLGLSATAELLYLSYTEAPLDVTTEVCRCCGADAALESQHSHLVQDSVLNGQPVQVPQ